MAFSAKHISVKQTGFFSALVTDYLAGEESLRSFYSHPSDINGITAAIEDRTKFNFDRQLLTDQLAAQYRETKMYPEVEKNLRLLAEETTFTVCTAHQPNIFTGHLYFVYKILHAIKLAGFLTSSFPGKNFVPVFYIGSEDADLEELGKIEVGGKKYVWNTEQKGAVGRMKVDKQLVDLIAELSGQISVLPHGNELIQLLRDSYKIGDTIERSTFRLVNEMFGRFGLIVLMPDNSGFKKSFAKVIHSELTEQFSSAAVRETIGEFPEKYKVQAGGRDINLFYLKDQFRERIEKLDNGFVVNNSQLSFTLQELEAELKNSPERFSPNVILRPLYQEWILPNVAFIGGGGELAYWLELKKVFLKAGIPMPVLVLRNSFLIIPAKWRDSLGKLNLTAGDLFEGKEALIKKALLSDSTSPLELNAEMETISSAFNSIFQLARTQDKSLEKHVLSIQHSVLNKISGVEKKMMRAAKKRESTLVNQIVKLHETLFPGGELQERVESIVPFYASHGRGLVDELLQHSQSLEQYFTIITEE